MKFGLLGKNLSHSFSEIYFQAKFTDLRLHGYSYSNFELSDISQFPRLLKEQPDLKGLNVTLPYKESVIPYLDELSQEAKAIGAVNTIRVESRFRKAFLIGYNTDAWGFHQSIKPFLEGKHERALVFGTGGAAKAVTHVLEGLGIEVLSVSRNKKDNVITYQELNGYVLKAHLLLINTTPVGMYPRVNEVLNIPFEFIGENHLVVDLIYNPEETLLLNRAKKQGAKILNGMPMLIHQAEKTWGIWNS